MHGSRENFDPIQFLDYLRSRGLAVAAVCGLAVIAAFVISLALPKRYTATSTILIQAPAGNDPRASTAVSQVYIDSLKTYESFATSDTLFEQAVEHLHLAAARGSVLKVDKLPNTSILRISATLRDPREAHALAQYIAEQTVAMGNSITQRSRDNRLKAIRDEMAAALEAWQNARRRRNEVALANPIEQLEDELSSASRLNSDLDRNLEMAKADVAELSARQSPDAVIAGARARVTSFEDQRREIIEQLRKLTPQLESRKVRRDELASNEDIAHTAYDNLRATLDDMLSAPDSGGPQLEIVDSGIVPRRPVYPNTALNVAAAFFAALVVSFTFLVLRFSYARLARESAERVYSLR